MKKILLCSVALVVLWYDIPAHAADKNHRAKAEEAGRIAALERACQDNVHDTSLFTLTDTARLFVAKGLEVDETSFQESYGTWISGFRDEARQFPEGFMYDSCGAAMTKDGAAQVAWAAWLRGPIFIKKELMAE